MPQKVKLVQKYGAAK